MKSEADVLDFFLGGNTKDGFVSLFDEITGLYKDYRCYIIKGGPGTGKSTLMKKILQKAKPYEEYSERIHCSSDPNSLDALILPQSKITALDGTPPHSVEPQYPGACESVVNLCDCWDEEKLKAERENIIDVSKKVSDCHKQCTGLLKAISSLLNDSYHIAMQHTDKDKIKKAVNNILERETKHKEGIKRNEKLRFLEAVTPKGFLCYTDTVNALCERIYILKDPYGATGEIFMKEIRTRLLNKNFEIYSCISPINLKTEHIIIPKLRLGFLTSTPFLPLEKVLTPFRTIHYTRFTDINELKKKKQRLKFNLRMANELLNESVFSLKKAKSFHDELEKFYTDACDYKKIDLKTEEILSKILKNKQPVA